MAAEATPVNLGAKSGPSVWHVRCVLLAFSVLSLETMSAVFCSSAGRGREFIFTFPTNLQQSSGPPGRSETRLTLSITAVRRGPTEVSVRLVDLGSWSKFVVLQEKHDAVNIEIPSAAEATGSGMQNTTVLVTSNRDVTVLALSNNSDSTGGFLVRSTQSLGTQYLIASYTPSVGEWSEFTISATEDDTRVHIRLEAPLIFDGMPFNRGELQLSMARLQTAQFQSSLDLTGSLIRANRPVSIISGSSATSVPAESRSSEYAVEHLPSISSLGSEYVIAPASSGSLGYVCVVVAVCPVTMIRGFNQRAVLNSAGDFYQWDAPADTLGIISSNKPVLVVQYSKGGQMEVSDIPNGESPGEQIRGPTMLVLQPTTRFVAGGALVSTPELPDGIERHVSITISCNETSGLRLNDRPLTQVRIFNYDSADTRLCVVQQRLATVGSPVVRVHHSSPTIRFAVAVTVHGGNTTRGAYTFSANPNWEQLYTCEGGRLKGVDCCEYSESEPSYSSMYSDYSSAYSSDSDSPPAESMSYDSVDYSPDPLQVTTSETITANTSPRDSIASPATGKLLERLNAVNRSAPSVANSTATWSAPSLTSSPMVVESNSVSGAETPISETRSQPGTDSNLRTNSLDPTNPQTTPPTATSFRPRTMSPATETGTFVDVSLTASTEMTLLVDTSTEHSTPMTSSGSKTSSGIHQTTEGIEVEITCINCEVPLKILFYGGVSMAALIIIVFLVCFISTMRKRRSSKLVAQKRSSLWVAYPARPSSADELSLGKMNLKHIEHKAPNAHEVDVGIEEPSANTPCNAC